MATRDFREAPQAVRDWATRTDLSTALLLPIVLLELAAFVAPFVLLVRISLYENTRAEAYVADTWTLENYQALLTDSYIHGRFFTTLDIAIVATVVTLVLGIYYAYVVWRSEGWLKIFLLVAMVLPLLTTLVVKLYAWVLLLAPLGTINDVLIYAGVIQEPIILMNNFTGVIVGLVYTTLPYTVLPVYAVLENMEWETVEAARVHGAGDVRSFFEIVIPAAIPGIIVSTVLTLVWNFGAYAAPGLLGSGREITLAMEVSTQLYQFNWPLAGALSLLMFILVILSTIALFNLLSRVGGGLEDVT